MIQQVNKNHKLDDPLMVFKLEDAFNKNIPKINGFVVYRFINLLDGKSYIGNSKNVNNRLRAHHKLTLNKENKPLYNSINKYGIYNFNFQILEICESKEEMDIREEYYISLYNSCEFGYNLNSSGKGNDWSYLWDQNWFKEKQVLDGKSRWEDDNFRNNLIKKLNNPELRERMRPICVANGKRNIKNLNAKVWSDPQHREKLRPIQQANGRNTLSKLHKDPEFKQRNIDRAKKLQFNTALKIINLLKDSNIEINKESYNKLTKKGQIKFESLVITYPQLLDNDVIESYYKNKVQKQVSDKLKKVSITKIIKTLKYLNDNNLKLNNENFNNHKSNGTPNYANSKLNYPELFNEGDS